MKLDIREKEQSRKEIAVSLSEGEVSGFFDDVLKKAVSDAKVPGFRKGKVPAGILELRMGKQLKSEVFDAVFREAFRKASEGGELEPVSYPEIDAGGRLPERGREFSFSILLDVMPEVAVGEYRGVSLEKENVEVTDAVVDDVFRREQEAYAGLMPVEGRPVQKDDRVTVEGEMTAGAGGGEAVPETVVPVGTGALPPEIEDGLVGAGIGEEKEISVNSQDGKTRVYRLRIKGIQEKKKIISGDDSAKAAGFSSREEWRGDVKKRILARVEQRVERELRFKAVDLVVDAAGVELPERMVASREEYFRKVYEAMGKETGEPVDGAKARELAERQVKENLVINKISRVENIDVSDEEVSARRNAILSRAGKDSVPDDDEIRYSIRREKVVDFILENAVIKNPEKPLILRPDEVNLVSER